MVSGASGSLAHDGFWWTFVFDDDADNSPIRLLPNAALDPMVRTVRGTDAHMKFELSGELTVFAGENYLLPTVAMRTAEVAPAPVSEVAPDAAPGPRDHRDLAFEHHGCCFLPVVWCGG